MALVYITAETLNIQKVACVFFNIYQKQISKREITTVQFNQTKC